jgi:hypothetical protein
MRLLTLLLRIRVGTKFYESSRSDAGRAFGEYRSHFKPWSRDEVAGEVARSLRCHVWVRAAKLFEQSEQELEDSATFQLHLAYHTCCE